MRRLTLTYAVSLRLEILQQHPSFARRFVTHSSSPRLPSQLAGRWNGTKLDCVIFTGLPPSEQAPLPSRLGRRQQGQNWSEPSTEVNWVKMGLQLTGDTLNASCPVVTLPSGAGWSLSPVLPGATPHEALPLAISSLRIKFERIGDALWVWYRTPRLSTYLSIPSPASAGAEWREVREAMGFFSGVEDTVWIVDKLLCWSTNELHAESFG